MATALTEADQGFLTRAIELSRHALEDEGKTPFGAIVVIDGAIVSEGTSSVVELSDPTAHAEVMALRHAGKKLGRHLFEDGVMYASSEPCPMCLVACYWARLPRIVFGATSHDVALNGFEDLQLYRELTYPADRRSLREDVAGGRLGEQAAEVLRSWGAALPETVVPKL
ncbi:nucleoside deaminase [Streptomyces sp. H39-S7]|uniref:nucleoside deaminase n=1 Tax=Streptomyces sp. H39-S7 TaxID=3004357 RepID=UPI0022AFF842|nr:nucleoside deaminase [Streptomyces sp. H39-S7]MCZ4125980.1 nucleoside deaminase [Streptomyces sp. H39-S7]